MDTHHAVHIAAGCLFGGALFAALLVFGAGLQWATAAFIIAMVLCHGFGFYYLKTRGDDEKDVNAGENTDL